MSAVEVEGRTVEVSHPDKVLFADAGHGGATKTDVVAYHEKVAPWMVPHVADRPLTMVRLPDGADGEGFVQKSVPDHFPDWVATVDVANVGGGTTTYVVCQDAATLAYLAAQAVLVPHVWPSRTDALDHPDQLVLDLDPPGDDPDHVDAVQDGARRLRDLLRKVGLTPYVKSSGSKGLHVHVPLDRSAGFDETRALAQALAARVADDAPDTFTVERSKDKRHGRVFLDTGRNAYGQHAVAPYALRAFPEAPVALPLDWDEALASDFHPRAWTLDRALRRLPRKKDPWRDMGDHPGRVADATGRLDS
jgi:bifunctional non-homologous end joining protein LigD